MHTKKKFAIIYSTVLCVVILFAGKISCDKFISYMDWEDLVTVERGQ